MPPPAHDVLARITASACTVDGCDRPSWSAGLCRVHYRRHLRRHGGHGGHHENGAGGHNGYDVRFVGLFLNELEVRGFPCYPQTGWFTALRRADYEFTYSAPRAPVTPSPPGPGSGFRALPREVAGVGNQGLYGAYGAYSSRAEGVLQSVNAACTRWLSAH